MDSNLFHTTIENSLAQAVKVEAIRVEELLAKAAAGAGLTLDEAAVLLLHADAEALFEEAINVKEQHFGMRMALFTPLYLSNICKNNCLYCGFRVDNEELSRRSLNSAEIAREAKVLASQGHRIVLLICGEDTNVARLDYVSDAIRTVAATEGISRVNLEVAPLEVEEYRILKEAGAGTYILFQETYHPQTYQQMHPEGEKANFTKRYLAPFKAVEAGFNEVGLGILLGLRDYRYDFLGMVAHALAIQERFGFYPSSFSLPRLKPALNAPLQEAPNPLSNLDFRRIAALLRLVFPSSEIILTTRETQLLRNSMMRSGISMFSAGSKTYPGGYSEEQAHAPQKEQFHLDDVRSLEEIVSRLVQIGEVPSFSETLSPGSALVSGPACQEKALLSFADYLRSYAGHETFEQGRNLINSLLAEVNNTSIKGEIGRILKQR